MNDESDQESNPSPSNKMDSLRREDLLAVVKKQYISLNLTKKQLELYKAEIKKKDKLLSELNANSESPENEAERHMASDMLSIELADYKQRLENTRKLLDERQKQLNDITEIQAKTSKKYQILLEERETDLTALQASVSEKNEMQKILSEKSRLISENSKEIDALVLEISTLKFEMETEIQHLNRELNEKLHQISEMKRFEQQSEHECRQLKKEFAELQQKYSDLTDEHAQFKSRAEYLLYQQSSTESDMKSDEHQKKSTEVQKLIEAINIKNEEISQLKNRYSMLEEELQISLQDAKNLEAQLNATINSHSAEVLRESNNHTKEIIKLERTIAENAEIISCLNKLNSSFQAKYDIQISDLTREWEERTKLLINENRTLKEELVKTKSELSDNIESFKSKKKPSALLSNDYKPSTQCNRPQLPTKLILNEPYNDDEVVTNSESEDEEFSLQSIINDTKYNSGECLPINNQWEFQNEEPFSDQSTDHYEEKINSLQSQLAHTREILADTEETNIKLNEQMQLFKEEIRRAQRNRERELHVSNNSEYLKNVIVSFLAPQRVNEERLQMMPVLKTILKLTTEEANAIERHIRNPSDQEGQADWSSYLRLRNLF